MVYRLAVCDDLKGTLAFLSSAIEEAFEKHRQMAIVDTFSSSKDLLRAVLQQKRYDVYFLDIDMPELNGIDLGSRLQKYHAEDNAPILVYVSNREDRVFETFKTRPLRFIRKRKKKKDF